MHLFRLSMNKSRYGSELFARVKSKSEEKSVKFDSIVVSLKRFKSISQCPNALSRFKSFKQWRSYVIAYACSYAINTRKNSVL